MSYLILDIENDSSKSYGRKVGHFKYDPIVALACKNEHESVAMYVYPNGIKQLEIDEDILVGFHLQHDLLFLWKQLDSFFQRGGRIWDCQIVEYMLSGQQLKFPSLRDVAVQNYKQPERVKWIDTLLFNKETKDPAYEKVSDLPKEKVIEDVKNDVLDTEVIYLKQLQQVKLLGMLPLVYEFMDGVLAFCEMEYNGMYINHRILESHKIELQTELKKIRDKFIRRALECWNANF